MDGCQIRGEKDAEIRTLKQLGYDVIAVNEDNYKEIPDNSKLAYLLELMNK